MQNPDKPVMNTEKPLSKKETEALVVQLLAGFIRDGHINPVGKTGKELIGEVRSFFSEEYEDIRIIDHTEAILIQARFFRKEGYNEFACVFYATWLEHTLNGFIHSFATQKRLSDKEIANIIRDTSYKSKISWLPVVFGKRPFKESQIKMIVKLMEIRNSFIHYKWQPNNANIKKELEEIILNVEKIVKYVRSYESKYVIGLSKRRIKKMINSA